MNNMETQNLSWEITLSSQNQTERFHLNMMNRETLAILLPDLPSTPRMIMEMRTGKRAPVRIANRAGHSLTAGCGDQVDIVFEHGTNSSSCFTRVTADFADFVDRKLPEADDLKSVLVFQRSELTQPVVGLPASTDIRSGTDASGNKTITSNNTKNIYYGARRRC
jgi:hypothetical protein